MYSKNRSKDFLKGVRTYRVTPQVELAAIETFLSSLDCARALTVWLLFTSSEHDQLVNLAFDPLAYNTAEEAQGAYIATCFFSKYSNLHLDTDKDRVALTKFEEFETLCRTTNARFDHLESDPLFKGPIVRLHSAVVRKIQDVLGEFDVDEFVSYADWGPGASTTIKRRDASAARKFQNETGITRDLHFLLPTELLRVCYPLWTQHLESREYPNFQIGNRIVTVPKNAKTNRVIAIEPGINLWFQKSIGDMIALRLLRVGIDLKHQERNQHLARVGSIDSSLATVDLSSASDSISDSVVRELVPPKWYSVMDSCRSRYGVFSDQSVKRWAKFSSMGNGFTFPLESLIFYAVAKCCVEYCKPTGRNTVSVYGDDVIIPTSCYRLFSELMTFYGFRINETKSYATSPFRESCGAHYFSGIDLKPVYLKDKLSSILTIYRLANAIRRLAFRQGAYLACDAKYRAAFDLLVSSVPKALRLRIPNSLGDGGFISCFDEATPVRLGRTTSTFGWEGFRVRHVQEAALSCYEEGVGYSLAVYWRMSKRDVGLSLHPEHPYTLKATSDLTAFDAEDTGGNLTPLHRTKLKVARSVVPQWDDLGPWI